METGVSPQSNSSSLSLFIHGKRSGLYTNMVKYMHTLKSQNITNYWINNNTELTIMNVEIK